MVSGIHFGNTGLVKKIHPYGKCSVVGYKFGTGHEGKAGDVYYGAGTFGVKVKLPLWTKAPSGGL